MWAWRVCRLKRWVLEDSFLTVLERAELDQEMLDGWQQHCD